MYHHDGSGWSEPRILENVPNPPPVFTLQDLSDVANNPASTVDVEMYRQSVVDDFSSDHLRLLNPSTETIVLPSRNPTGTLSGITSDPTQLCILIHPNSIIHNNACAKERFTSVIFLYKGYIPPNMSITEIFAISVSLRVLGSPTTYFTSDLEVKKSIVDERNGYIQIDLKITKVSSKVHGSPYSFALILKPKVDLPGVVAQVSETGDILVKSQKAKAPSLTKIEEKLLEHEWIQCYCPGQCPRFCPLCRVPEYNSHKTSCFFHDVLLKQQRVLAGGKPPSSKIRKLK